MREELGEWGDSGEWQWTVSWISRAGDITYQRDSLPDHGDSSRTSAWRVTVACH